MSRLKWQCFQFRGTAVTIYVSKCNAQSASFYLLAGSSKGPLRFPFPPTALGFSFPGLGSLLEFLPIEVLKRANQLTNARIKFAIMPWSHRRVRMRQRQQHVGVKHHGDATRPAVHVGLQRKIACRYRGRKGTRCGGSGRQERQQRGACRGQTTA
jgi:hypothetical protein